MPTQAPTAGSVDFGILLKQRLMVYYVFGIPFFLNASATNLLPIAMWLGIFGVFYGAFLALPKPILNV